MSKLDLWMFGTIGVAVLSIAFVLVGRFILCGCAA